MGLLDLFSKNATKTKTFDIALEYLKDMNVSGYNLYSFGQNERFTIPLLERLEKFKKDKKNTVSNDYYKSLVFECCFLHIVFKAQGLTSFFDIACQIVQTNKGILSVNNYERYGNTEYPKVMVDAFIAYCDELKPQPYALDTTSEVRHEFFMSAYHYTLDKVA